MAEPFYSAGAGVKNAGGALSVDRESVLASYSYASVKNTPAATTTVLLTLTGSATKIIRVKRIVLSGGAGTAGSMYWSLIRYSTAASSGTSTAPTPAKKDANDPAATGTLALYTANPTAGTAAATIYSGRVFLNLVTAQPDRCVIEPGLWGGKSIVLRGTSDILGITFDGSAVPASGVLDVSIHWTEE